MPNGFRRLLFPATALVLLPLLPGVLASADSQKHKKVKHQESAAASAIQTPAPMDDRQRALHALNRLTFGPRPGDLERVEAIGVDQWIDLQLHPENIKDDALEARLAPYNTLRMNTATLVRDFPPPQVVKAVADGRVGMPSDPGERAIYQAQLDRLRAKQENRQAAGQSAQPQPDDAVQSGAKRPGADGVDAEARMYADLHDAETLQLPPDERMQAILRMEPEQRQRFFQSTTPDEKARLVDGLSPKQRETLLALAAPQAVIQGELQQAKMLRAIYSERQLEEVMTDFWFNHFNVFIDKGADKYLITAYERDVIRPRVFGKFKDLLLATAKSPAMLFYLDNWQSVGPDSDSVRNAAARNGLAPRFRPGFPPPGIGQQSANPKKQVRGLNENYAREVMELHTLGVDGGYTQADVTQLARILTGWTLDRRGPGPGVNGYIFNERLHEPGKKVLLGKTFGEDGEREGEKALEMLAQQPATANFLSKKLAIRFVSDNPPPALVDRMAQTFLNTDGDIREVLKTMFTAPEFWAADTYRAKVKTPLEFVVSATRASGADVSNPQALVETLRRMGMPLYGMQPPTGYSSKSDVWVNSAALLDRMNFGVAFSTDRVAGSQVDWQQLESASPAPADVNGALAVAEGLLLSGDVSSQTHAALLKQLNDHEPGSMGALADNARQGLRIDLIAGLVLGSPEFQRR